MFVLIAVVIDGTPYRHAMPRHRSARETIVAWIVTGPVGHLVAGVADWLALLGRLVRARARGERL
jgi:phosphate/sulfate permease